MPVLEVIGAAVEGIGTAAAEVAQKGAELAVETVEKTAEAVGETVEKTAEVVGETAEKVGETAEKVREAGGEAVEGIKSHASESNSFVKTKLNEIRWTTPEQLNGKLEECGERIRAGAPIEGPEEGKKCEGLSDAEKKKVREETRWSDMILDNIGSMEENEIYKKAGLQEAEIGGRRCLLRDDIDWTQKDAMGRTNFERAEQGLSPCNKEGKVIELHHIGQHADSPLAELTQEEHRGRENYSILHYKGGESEIDRNIFGEERTEHWEERAKERRAV